MSSLSRSIVLIGMPGAGKSTIGKKLAQRLGAPFADADLEIERAAGMAVSDIFAKLGEPAFREGERKVIARLLSGAPLVLSTGGGAFMNEETRGLIEKQALSLWLKVDFDILLARVQRSGERPLLKKGDPATILRDLRTQREPVYARADLVVQTDDRPADDTVARVLEAVQTYLGNRS